METIEQLNNKFIQEAKRKELQEFCEKQHRELLILLDKNKTLEDENEHLKKLVTSNDSFVITGTKELLPEELICLEQINMLKKASETSALTLDEARKLDTYVKLIRLIRGKEKSDDLLKGFNVNDLLKVVESDGK